MNDGRQLIRATTVIVTVMLVGTLGYMLIEGWSVVDAVYMTVTTMATVGFGEIHPLSPNGRLFTIGLIILGVGGALYVLTAMMQFVFEGHLGRNLERRRMERRIDRVLSQADVDLLLEDFTIRPDSPLVGKTVRQVGQDIAPGVLTWRSAARPSW